MANWVADYLLRHPDMAARPIYKRARHSLHFVLTDGSIQAEFTGAPCHYLDDSQGWLPLDTALQTIGNEYGAPGLATRIDSGGGVRIVDKKSATLHQQQSGRFVILNTLTGKVKDVKAKLSKGRVDGDKFIRETGIYQHALRVTETGLREELLITQPLPSGAASEWAMLETEIIGQNWPDGWLDANLPAVAGHIFTTPYIADAAGNITPARRYALKQGNRQFIYTGVPLAWLAGAAYPVVLDPDYVDTTNDGVIIGTSSTYSTANSTASSAIVNRASESCGQLKNSKSAYFCDRIYLRFDTSTIPAGSSVTAATMTLTVTTNYSATDSDIDIVKQNWSAQDPITGAGMATAFSNTLTASLDDHIWRNTYGISTNTPYTSGALNTAWVTVAGYTYYSLISSLDRAGTPPVGVQNDTVDIAMQDHATSGYRPIITVTYTEGGGSSVSPSSSASVSVSPSGSASLSTSPSASGSASISPSASASINDVQPPRTMHQFRLRRG